VVIVVGIDDAGPSVLDGLHEAVADWRRHRLQQGNPSKQKHGQQQQQQQQQPTPEAPGPRSGPCHQGATDDAAGGVDLVGQGFDGPVDDEGVAEPQRVDDATGGRSLALLQRYRGDVVGELGEHLQPGLKQGRRRRRHGRRHHGAEVAHMAAEHDDVEDASVVDDAVGARRAGRGLVVPHKGSADETAPGHHDLGGCCFGDRHGAMLALRRRELRWQVGKRLEAGGRQAASRYSFVMVRLVGPSVLLVVPSTIEGESSVGGPPSRSAAGRPAVDGQRVIVDHPVRVPMGLTAVGDASAAIDPAAPLAS
jgi:hypothetical protein